MTADVRALRDLLTDRRPPDVTVPWRPVGPAVAEAGRWVQQGLLRPVLGPVVVAADVDLDLDRRAAALAALVPAEAVVIGCSAAWLHLGGTPPCPVEVAMPRTAARTSQRQACTGQAPVRVSSPVPVPRDVQRVGGVLVTTPARTAVDVARAAPRDVVRDLLDRFRAAGLDPDALVTTLAGMRGARNIRRSRDLLEAAGALG